MFGLIVYTTPLRSIDLNGVELPKEFFLLFFRIKTFDAWFSGFYLVILSHIVTWYPFSSRSSQGDVHSRRAPLFERITRNSIPFNCFAPPIVPKNRSSELRIIAWIMTTKSDDAEWAPNDVWDTTWGAVQYKYIEMAARQLMLISKQHLPMPDPDIEIPTGLPACTQEKELVDVLWKYCRRVRVQACRLQRAAEKEKQTAEIEILNNYWLEEKGHEMPKELEPKGILGNKKFDQKAYKVRQSLRTKNAKECDLSMYVLLRDGIRPLAPKKKRRRDAFEMLRLETRSVLGTDKHLLPSLNLPIPKENQDTHITPRLEELALRPPPTKKIRTVESIFPPEPPLSEEFCKHFLALFNPPLLPPLEVKQEPDSPDSHTLAKPSSCTVCIRRGSLPPWKFETPAEIYVLKNLQLDHPEVYATLDLDRCKREGVDISKLTCLSTEEAFWICTHTEKSAQLHLMDFPPSAPHSWGEAPWLRINNWKSNPKCCPMCQIVRDLGNRFLRRQLWSIPGLMFEREKQLAHMLSIWENPLRCDAYVCRTPACAPVVFESDHAAHFPEMKEGELVGPHPSVRGNDRVKNVCLVWAGIHLMRFSERISEPMRAHLIRTFLRDSQRLPKGQILVRLAGFYRWEYDAVYWMDAFRFNPAPVVERDGVFITEVVVHLKHIDHQLHEVVKRRLHEIVAISGQPQQHLFHEFRIAMKMRRDPFHVTTTVWEELFG